MCRVSHLDNAPLNISTGSPWTRNIVTTIEIARGEPKNEIRLYWFAQHGLIFPYLDNRSKFSNHCQRYLIFVDLDFFPVHHTQIVIE